MTRPIRIPALALPVLLSACSPPPIRIEISQIGGKVVANLSQDWGFIFSRKEAPCIREIELRTNDSQSGSLVWQARRKGDDTQCTHLGAIVIGKPPPGFEQITPLVTTLHGAHRLTVRGIGFGHRIIAMASAPAS